MNTVLIFFTQLGYRE